MCGCSEPLTKRIRSSSPSRARSVGPGHAAVVGPGRVLDARGDLDLLVARDQGPLAQDPAAGEPRGLAPVEVAQHLGRVEAVGARGRRRSPGAKVGPGVAAAVNRLAAPPSGCAAVPAARRRLRRRAPVDAGVRDELVDDRDRGARRPPDQQLAAVDLLHRRELKHSRNSEVSLANFLAGWRSVESIAWHRSRPARAGRPVPRHARGGGLLVERPGRALIAVAGPDAAEFLQGQVTNDVEAIEPGDGRYAALLDRKGHMQADMRMLRRGEGEFLLDTEGAAGPAAEAPLDLQDRPRGRGRRPHRRARLISLIGPRSRELSRRRGPRPRARADRELEIGGVGCRAVATDRGST